MDLRRAVDAREVMGHLSLAIDRQVCEVGTRPLFVWSLLVFGGGGGAESVVLAGKEAPDGRGAIRN